MIFDELIFVALMQEVEAENKTAAALECGMANEKRTKIDLDPVCASFVTAAAATAVAASPTSYHARSNVKSSQKKAWPPITYMLRNRETTRLGVSSRFILASLRRNCIDLDLSSIYLNSPFELVALADGDKDSPRCAGLDKFGQHNHAVVQDFSFWGRSRILIASVGQSGGEVHAINFGTTGKSPSWKLHKSDAWAVAPLKFDESKVVVGGTKKVGILDGNRSRSYVSYYATSADTLSVATAFTVPLISTGLRNGKINKIDSRSRHRVLSNLSSNGTSTCWLSFFGTSDQLIVSGAIDGGLRLCDIRMQRILSEFLEPGKIGNFRTQKSLFVATKDLILRSTRSGIRCFTQYGEKGLADIQTTEIISPSPVAGNHHSVAITGHHKLSSVISILLSDNYQFFTKIWSFTELKKKSRKEFFKIYYLYPQILILPYTEELK
eukprot:UC4_evm3s89